MGQDTWQRYGALRTNKKERVGHGGKDMIVRGLWVRLCPYSP